MPTSSATTIGAGLEEQARVRQREADRVEQPEEELGEPEAEEEPDDRGHDADDERLEDDRAEHLPARRADRSQGRELARPLRDRDRERVRDHERADEERDAAEREQERLQEGDELVGVLGVGAGLLLRRSAPGCSGAGSRGSRRRAAWSETPGFAATAISSSLPGLSKMRWAVGRSKPARVAPPIVDTEPNLTIPEMRRFWTGPTALDADDVTDLEVLLVGGRAVDDDVAVARARSPRRAAAG